MTEPETDTLSLAADFPPADRDAWRALVDAALKGVPYDKALTRTLAEGLRTEPIYTGAEAPPPADMATRNALATDRAVSGWEVRQHHAHPDPIQVNREILADLERGVQSVQLRLDQAGRRGGTALSDPADAGIDGVMVYTLSDLQAALDGVFVEAARVALQPGAAFEGAAAMMMALWSDRGLDPAQVLGHLGADPLGALAEQGTLTEPVDRSVRRLADLAAHVAATYPQVTTVSVDTAAYHGAGADEAMDLACAVATGLAYLRAMEDVGLTVEAAAAQIEFSLPVGVDVFLGIAKLRAIRRLWAEVLAACGVAEDRRSMRLHVTTAENAWSGRDPWVNMLRATVATFAGAVGGADSLTVLPYSHVLGLPDGFARRIARNTQVILAEESSLARVIDPAGGSWYVETLTEQLASKAWERFQAIEGAGGMVQHLTSGAAAAECASAWAERERRIAGRREQLIGVSAFPKVDEKPVDVNAVDLETLVTAARQRLQANAGERGGADTIVGRVRMASSGADLTALVGEDSDPTTTPPLASHRLGEAFEALRDAADAHAQQTGTRPSAVLVLLGGPAQATTRATFARNHLGTGGIECVDCDGDDPDAVSAALGAAGADLAVICSSDSIYQDRAAETARQFKGIGAREVLLAGRPGEHEAAWRTAGIDGYLFAGDDTLATVRGVLARLGVPGVVPGIGAGGNQGDGA